MLRFCILLIILLIVSLLCIGKTVEEEFIEFRDENKIPRNQLANEIVLHSQNISNKIRDGAIYNILNYIEPLKNIKTIELKVNKSDPRFSICNPSILKRTDGKYIVNIRENNYHLDVKNHNFHFFKDDNETVNHLIVLNNNINELDNNILKSKQIQTPFHLIKPNFPNSFFKRNCTGFEDLRLIEYNDTLYSVGTTKVTSKDNLNETILLKYDKNFDIDKVVRLRYQNNLNQKNWIPFITDENEFLLLYSSYPTLILKPNLDTGECKVKSNKTPKYKTNYRGGTQFVKFTYKNIPGYLFIVHQEATETISLFGNKRFYYYHRFVFMDTDFNITNITKLFYFLDKTTEFASGMTLDKDGENLLISIGFEDNKAYLIIVPVIEVEKLLIEFDSFLK